MPSAGDGAEFLADLIARRDRVIAANPHAHDRIMGQAPKFSPAPVPSVRPATIRPMFERGRYVSPALTRLTALVARLASLSPEAIRGEGRKVMLVHARFCIANLAEEFAPRLSCGSIDNGMLRGQGMTAWHRARHRDRIEMFPNSYGDLYERCRAELLAGAP
jgi:hypothetical protein